MRNSEREREREREIGQDKNMNKLLLLKEWNIGEKNVRVFQNICH